MLLRKSIDRCWMWMQVHNRHLCEDHSHHAFPHQNWTKNAAYIPKSKLCYAFFFCLIHQHLLEVNNPMHFSNLLTFVLFGYMDMLGYPYLRITYIFLIYLPYDHITLIGLLHRSPILPINLQYAIFHYPSDLRSSIPPSVL